MKFLLIDPPDINRVYGKISNKIKPFAPSLGLAYITAVLKKNNIPLKLIDARGEYLSIQEVVKEIQKYKPQVIGITCLTPSFGTSIEIAKRIKEISKNIIVVLGGPHITPTAEETLKKYPDIDITVFGEGEYTMLEIAKGMAFEKIKGIAFRKNGEIIVNKIRPLIEDIDTIPFPERSFYNFNNYHQLVYEVNYGTPITTIITSRGCPYNCSFCSSKITFGRKVRFRSVENVLNEIDLLINKYNIKGIKFSDDTFTLNRKRIEQLLLEIKKREIYWIGNARVETIDKNLLVLMKETNCKLIQFGIESGDPIVLKQLKNTVNLEKTQEVLKYANELKIQTSASFIFGAPFETPKTAKKTIKFAKKINPTYANFFILSPYPGTEIYEYMNKHNMMKIKDWTQVKSPKYNDYIIKHPNFSDDDLKKLQRRAYRQFYFNFNYIFLVIKRLNSIKQFFKYIKLATIALSFIKINKLYQNNE